MTDMSVLRENIHEVGTDGDECFAFCTARVVPRSEAS
jgi:hypothetical protein